MPSQKQLPPNLFGKPAPHQRNQVWEVQNPDPASWVPKSCHHEAGELSAERLDSPQPSCPEGRGLPEHWEWGKTLVVV